MIKLGGWFSLAKIPSFGMTNLPSVIPSEAEESFLTVKN
jgi:hypothetical protein